MSADSQFLIYAVLLVFFTGCNADDQSESRESDRQKLEQQFNEIVTLAQSAQCIDSADWSYVAYGAKACGGPQGFMAFYLKTDTLLLFAQLNSYESNERTYNQRWNIISNCITPQIPKGVTCTENKAFLIYD